MTELEQSLADAKMEAEIARLKAETERLNDNAVLDKKIRAEISKLIAETSKINREFQWYPFVMLTAAVAATATIVKLFFWLSESLHLSQTKILWTGADNTTIIADKFNQCGIVGKLFKSGGSVLFVLGENHGG